MYWMPSSSILARTCFTSSLRPLALTWASKSVIYVPLSFRSKGVNLLHAPCRASLHRRRIPLRRSLSWDQSCAIPARSHHAAQSGPVVVLSRSALPSAPGIGAVGNGVELPGREAREAERFEQLGASADDVVGDQLTDADHLVAVVGIGDDVDVVAEPIEDRKAVGGEAANAARRLLLVLRNLDRKSTRLNSSH